MENAGRTKLLPLGQVTLREEPIFLTPPLNLIQNVAPLNIIKKLLLLNLIYKKTVPIVSINKYGLPKTWSKDGFP